jgi:hypothetical protein
MEFTKFPRSFLKNGTEFQSEVHTLGSKCIDFLDANPERNWSIERSIGIFKFLCAKECQICDPKVRQRRGCYVDG